LVKKAEKNPRPNGEKCSTNWGNWKRLRKKGKSSKNNLEAQVKGEL